jgi:hypothetical protein
VHPASDRDGVVVAVDRAGDVKQRGYTVLHRVHPAVLASYGIIRTESVA